MKLTKNDKISKSIILRSAERNKLPSSPANKFLFQLPLPQAAAHWKIRTVKNDGRIISPGVLHAEKLELEDADHNVVLIPSSTYKFKMRIGSEPTVMYLIASLMDTEATPIFFSTAFLKLQLNSRIKCQDTLRLRKASKKSPPVIGEFLLNTRIGGLWFEHVLASLTIWPKNRNQRCIWRHRRCSITTFQ